MKEDDEDIRFRIYPATLNVSIWWDTHWGTDITSSIGLTQHQSNRMSDKELLRGLKIIRWAKEFAQYHVDVMEVING